MLSHRRRSPPTVAMVTLAYVYTLSLCVEYQVGCHTFNLPANTHQQENLFQGQRIRAETPVDVTGCVSCQISSVLLEVIGSRRIAKELLPSLFVWSRLGVLLTFMELDSGNKPWHKALSSPTASSQRCCTHGTHISRTHTHTHTGNLHLRTHTQQFTALTVSALHLLDADRGCGG